MNSKPVSDREKAGLRGPVKTLVDEWSTTVFDRDGKILEWRGNTFHGPAERTYEYDEQARLTRITSSNGDRVDEFRYDDQGRKTQIRQLPARTDQGAKAWGLGIWFEAVSEGEMLTDGGTVETTYNESDQPVEIRVADDEGILLFRIVHLYDVSGRLAEERLTTENFHFPKALRDQIPPEQRDALLAQMKTEYKRFMQSTGLFGNAERTYVYNGQGHVAERYMRMGPIREDLTRSYNGHGFISESKSQTSGFPHEHGGQPLQTFSCSYTYQYDDYGNWSSRSETSAVGGNSGTHAIVRQLTYHH